MSEELKPETPVTPEVSSEQPAPAADAAPVADPLANAEVPVAPEQPAPAPAMADQAEIAAASEQPAPAPSETIPDQPAEPAAAEQAPTEPTPASVDPISAETGLPAEPLKAKIETPSEPTTPPEAPAPKPKSTPSPVSIIKNWIKQTGKTSVAAIQLKLKLPVDVITKALDELHVQGFLGPRIGDNPQEVLGEVIKQPPKAEPKKKFDKNSLRPRVTDYERLQKWSESLKNIGKIEDDALIKLICDYALKNSGFNPKAKWGSCLIVMINRFLTRCRDHLRSFTRSDSEFLIRELLRFISEQPLGDGVIAWNTNYQTNGEQRKAVSEFFGIDCPFRELRNSNKLCLTTIRDAAWPTSMEEKNGIGGTYAERFHYLVMAICTFGNNADFADVLFNSVIHTQPTEEFFKRLNGVADNHPPKWVKDGKCVECDSEVGKDSNGFPICTNPLCPNHFAKAMSFTPKSFREGFHGRSNGGFRGRTAPSPDFDPNSVPVPTPDGGRRNKKNWKRRKDDDDQGEDGFRSRKQPKGKRYRVNDDDSDFDGGGTGGDMESPSLVSCGGQCPSTIGDAIGGALSGLEIPPENAGEQPNA